MPRRESQNNKAVSANRVRCASSPLPDFGLTGWRMRLIASMLLAVSALVGRGGATANEPTAEPAGSPGAESAADLDSQQALAEAIALIPQLDSDRCDVRDRAARQLETWMARPELAAPLAAEFRKALVANHASFELRARLSPLLARLPAAPLTAPAVELAEIPLLVAQLADDSYGARQTAADRLAWAIGNAEATCPILVAMRELLADPELDPGLRREVAPLWKKVRAAWLSSDPASWQLPAVSDEQVAGWVADLRKPVPADWTGIVYPPHEIARRELLDLLARDEYVPKVKEILAANLTDQFDPTTYELRDIRDWTLPGLVAEIWEERLNGTGIATVQYLALGVPCQPEGAERPSLFDTANEHSAHCVSGNSLSTGDWPVGVAFPSPIAEDKFFHLINLPTPRHRLAYEANVDSDEQERLRVLSRRTLDAVLAAARPLTFGETMMLDKLDIEEVSRFAGPFFLAVDDQLFPPDIRHTPAGRASLHQTICISLAQYGTRTAIPGLMTAMERDRFLKPMPGSAFNWPWIAALSIAVHDPWPGVDRWLAEQVNQTSPLAIRPEGQELVAVPDIGGSAAAILLARHGLPPWAFRLERLWQPPIDNFDIPACRFVDAEDRRALLRWWTNLAGEKGSEPDTSASSAPASP